MLHNQQNLCVLQACGKCVQLSAFHFEPDKEHTQILFANSIMVITSIESVMPSSHLILCRPPLLPNTVGCELQMQSFLTTTLGRRYYYYYCYYSHFTDKKTEEA